MKNTESDTTFSPPPNLTIMREDSVGRVGYLVDESEGTSYFGGTYDESNRSYSFRLTRHLQNIVQKAYTNHFDLYMMLNSPLASVGTPNRVSLYGTKPQAGDDSNKMKLKITYTILNK
jgi:hypothetical protein